MKLNIPGELRDAIEKENLVVFVGAGLSINSGFPNWNNIVLDLLLENKEYINKAEDLYNALKADIITPLDVLDKIETDKKKSF